IGICLEFRISDFGFCPPFLPNRRCPAEEDVGKDQPLNGERAGVRGENGRGYRTHQAAPTLSLLRPLPGLPESSSWIILRAMEGKPRLIQLLSVSTSMCILAGGFAAEISDHRYAEDHLLIKFKGQIFSQLASLPRADALKWLLSNLNL